MAGFGEAGSYAHLKQLPCKLVMMFEKSRWAKKGSAAI
jgi:hypothetical protein